MKHQKEAVAFALKNNGVCAFFAEVGTGKTIMALATFAELRKSNPKLKMLVICPLSLIYGAWTREIEKFTTFKCFDLHQKKGESIAYFSKIDIFIINFESLLSPLKLVSLGNIMSCYDWFCTIDESSKMKSHDAKTTIQILKLKNKFKHRIPMSGTPAPNTEAEYWPQMSFMDDNILGGNFYKFKNTHFEMRRGKQTMPGGVMNRAAIRKMHEQGFKYEIIPKMREKMFDKMRPYCFQVKAKDCIDLPEEADEFRMVEMSEKQAGIYKQMKENYIAELGDDKFAVANIVLTKLLKLRQITSGFVINDFDEAVPVTPRNPKIAELLDIVDDCGQEQIIVWCQFHYEMDTLNLLLRQIAGVSQLHGRVPIGERTTQLDDFLSGKNRFLIAHPDSAAHGLTLTNCHISVFFSLDYSMEGYSQARGRTYRKGQKNNCLYFHILAKDTIDEDVLAIVQRKETAQEIAEKYLKNVKA